MNNIKMSFFPFIEGIFYLSLGIIIVLIFLIVFHFKQRIETLEKKSFLFTEMYNNLVKELNIVKSFICSPPAMQQKQNIVFSTIPNGPTTTDVDMSPYKKIIVMDKINEEDDDEDEDEDEDEEESDDEDTIKDFEINEMENIPMESIDLEVQPIHVIKIEKEDENPMVDIDMNMDVDIDVNVEIIPKEPTISYTKLNLNELKTLVISKGLSTNPNKMKRAELLKLLEETI